MSLTLLSFLQTTPAEVAVSALQANHELGHCTHVHGEMTANRGSPGFMPLEVMSEIISWTNFTTLTAFSKTNPLLHREVNKIIKSRVKDVLAHFFARTQLPDFFHRLAIAEAYVFGDVALNIVLAENWGCREMQIAVARDRAGPFIHWLSHRAGYHNTDIVGERKGCRRSVRLFNAQVSRVIDTMLTLTPESTDRPHNFRSRERDKSGVVHDSRCQRISRHDVVHRHGHIFAILGHPRREANSR